MRRKLYELTKYTKADRRNGLQGKDVNDKILLLLSTNTNKKEL